MLKDCTLIWHFYNQIGNSSCLALPKGGGERVKGGLLLASLLKSSPYYQQWKTSKGGVMAGGEINSPPKHRSHFYRQEGNSRGTYKGPFMQSISKGYDENSV